MWYEVSATIPVLRLKLKFQVETFQIFHVRKNGSINVSDKKPAMIRLLVDKLRGDETFVPGEADNPDPEERMLFLFFGDPKVAKADMNNLVATKHINQQSHHCTFLVGHID